VELYQKYKEKISNKTTKKWSNYQVFLNPTLAEKIKNFMPTDE